MPPGKSLRIIGAREGAKLGFRLSLAYTLLLPTYLVAVTIAGYIFRGTNAEIEVVPVLILITCFGFFIGVLPSVVLGAILGLLIVLIVQRIKANVNKRQAFLTGITLCLFLVSTINFLLLWYDLYYPPNISSLDPAYLFFIGVPSVICVLAGGWLSVRLYDQASAVQEAEKPEHRS